MRRSLVATLLLALAACAGAPPSPPPAASPTAGTRTVLTSRGRILVDDGGRGGVPVLFVHGAGGDHAVWAEPLAHARKTRRAVAIDLPGFGQSEAPRDGKRTAEAWGEDLGRVADALGLSRFVLVVHDFAGTVATAYASRHPLRVAGILFVDAYSGRLDRTPAVRAAEELAFAPERLAATVAARYGPRLAGAAEGTRQRVQAALDATPRESLLAAALTAVSNDSVAELSRYKGPRRALAASQLVLEGIQANVEGLPYRKVQGSSHWIMLDQPADVDAELDALLAQVK
ncbi:MAG TPA: alpha/beta hydrolase [Anaeromyxobacteraceae bacterium]|nr:alpha/beta hydrolase [Anaeromyxobacteraceae bacterium]